MGKIPAIAEFVIGTPHTIKPEETLALAEKVMTMHKIRHLPVLDGRRIFGIISDRDVKLAKAVNREHTVGQRSAERPVCVRDICISNPYTVDEKEALDIVALTMARRRLGCAIVTRKGALLGIFTTTDACRLLAEFARR